MRTPRNVGYVSKGLFLHDNESVYVCCTLRKYAQYVKRSTKKCILNGLYLRSSSCVSCRKNRVFLYPKNSEIERQCERCAVRLKMSPVIPLFAL